MKTILAIITLVICSVIAAAQTTPAPAPATGVTFGTYAGPASLCLGGSCNLGSLSKEELTITSDLGIGATQLVVPAINFQGYYGHASYSWAWESLFPKTQIPNHTLQFNLQGGAGVNNNTSVVAPGTPHLGAFTILNVNYAPASDGKFVLAGSIGGAYAPGFGTAHFGEVYTGFIGYLFGGTKPAGVTGVSALRRVWGTKAR